MAKGVGGGGRVGRAGGYRTFGGAAMADDWANLIYGKYMDELPEHMRDAIVYYTGAGYDDINPAFRAGVEPGGVAGERAKWLDRALALAPRVPAGGLTVRRRISSKLAATLRTGDVFEDLGFSSTSISPTFKFGGQTMWTIQIPGGDEGGVCSVY